MHKEGRSYEEIFYGLRGKIESSFALGLRDLLKSYCHQLYFTTQMDVLPRVFLLPLWVGGVLGLFRSPWDAILKKKVIFLLLFILFPLFFYPLFLVHERRFVPIIPLVMIFVAKGIIEFEHWFKETFGRNKWGLVLIFFLIASSFMPRLTGAMREKDPFLNEPAEYREAGRWMNEHLPLQAKIMARDPAIAFYADRRWEALPYGTLAEIVQNAKERQTDYIVFERYFAKLRPNLRYIMESDEELPGLKLVYRWDRRPEYKVLVYEVLSQS